MSAELISDKDALELYSLIKRLSPSQKDMVKTLVMSLLKEE